MCSGLHVSLVFREGAVRALNDPHDHPEQSQGTPEDLYDQDLHKGVRVLGVSDRATTARNTHTDAE